MKSLARFAVTALVAGICSCATSSLKRTWVSPSYTGGPVKSVAVAVVDDRPEVRNIIEGQFGYQLEQRGHPAVRVSQVLSPEEIRANREAAAATLRQAGATSVLILRVAGSELRLSETQETAHRFGVTATEDAGLGWFGYYITGLTDMAVVRSNLRQELYLEAGLHDLATGQRLWVGLTKTVLSEDMDRLAAVKPLVSAIIAGMRKDGVVR